MRCFNIVALGCGTHSRSAIARAFHQINGIFGIQRCPKRFSLREQSFQFGSVFSGRGSAIRIQILLQAGECRSDILHYLVIWSVLLRKRRSSHENCRDNDNDENNLSIHLFYFAQRKPIVVMRVSGSLKLR